MGNTLQSAVPLERNPIGTKAQQNENTCPIRSKEAFVLTGFRSDGPTPPGRPKPELGSRDTGPEIRDVTGCLATLTAVPTL